MSTLKKEIIKMFALAPSIDALAKNQVIFLTPMGFITGDLADNNECDSGTAVFSTIVEKANEPFKDVELADNDGYIQLANARLRPTMGSPCDLGDIVLFFDQIIGVKLGTIS